MNTLLVIIGAVVSIVVGVVKFKIHPFITLFTAAILVGILSGIGIIESLDFIAEGFGNTLSSVGIIIVFGSIIGTLLERTNAIELIVNQLLKISGLRNSMLAMNITGFIVSIPVFCDSAFIILSSINKSLSRRTLIPLGILGVSLATGLYAAHVFVPPTPGPLAASSILGADLGAVLIYGLLVGIPVSLVGFFSAKYFLFRDKKYLEGPRDISSSKRIKLEKGGKSIKAFLPIVVPIILIALDSIANYPTLPFGQGIAFTFFDTVGNPVIALFIGMTLSFLLVLPEDKYRQKQFTWTQDALKDAGLIILITGVGGAFGNVIRQLDIAEQLSLSSGTPIIGLILTFLIASALKSAQGSSTVSIVTTAALVAPLLENFGLDSSTGKTFAVLAIGSGAMTVSHLNDSYFWVVSQFSGMSVKSALSKYTVTTLLQGFLGLGLTLILYVLMA